jgi:hypothetical protein
MRLLRSARYKNSGSDLLVFRIICTLQEIYFITSIAFAKSTELQDNTLSRNLNHMLHGICDVFKDWVFFTFKIIILGTLDALNFR